MSQHGRPAKSSLWSKLQNADDKELTAWAEEQPWCRAMAECAQDVRWHAEGDVWTHTKRVLQELNELEEWSSLSPHDKTLLRFTALLHDSAKPLTTEVDDATGEIRSPMHSVKGEHIARSVLRDIGCELNVREQITKLVRYHGRPVFISKRNEPMHEVAKLSWLVDTRLLYLFAVADRRGRDTDSQTRKEEELEYWRLLAEEADCYGKRFSFATDHARFVFCRADQPNLHYIPHENFRCTVTVMSGLPGSGKDSWLSKHRPDIPVVSLDGLRDEMHIAAEDNQGRVVQAAGRRCREHLRAGRSFAFNATNAWKATRDRWLRLFADYDARIECVYIEPEWTRLLAQNHERERAVPENIIRRLAERLEPPNWLDCHQLTQSDSAW